MQQSASPRRWLKGLGSKAGTARSRVFYFPYAGGGASAYQGLVRQFSADVEGCPVQLPGREDRLSETPLTSMEAVVDGLLPSVMANLDLPYAFFGHSMGALIAFEVTRRLALEGAPLPSRLFVSAHRAPHLPDPDTPIHDLPHDSFTARLKSFAATPDEVLLDPELSEIFLPILRADFAVCETYGYVPGRRLDCPVTVLGGREDTTVSDAELDGWRQHTTGEFAVRRFSGGHFYLRDSERLVVDLVEHELIP